MGILIWVRMGTRSCVTWLELVLAFRGGSIIPMELRPVQTIGSWFFPPFATLRCSVELEELLQKIFLIQALCCCNPFGSQPGVCSKTFSH